MDKIIKYKGKEYFISDSGYIGEEEASCVGEYIEYDVDYIDAYENSKNYSKGNGWRILKKIDYANGKSDLQIISTGIPAKLQYDSDTIKSAIWAGTESERLDYVTSYFFDEDNKEAASVYAASGLINNFKDIIFQEGLSTIPNNTGAYKSIAKNGEKQTGEKTGKDLFLMSDSFRIRSIIHTDIPNADYKIKKTDDIAKVLSKDKIGLFKLNDLQYATGYYWIATTNVNGAQYLCNVWYDGRMRKS